MAYVQSNALKARSFDSLEAQNGHLAEWERTVADTRIHGTTRRQVEAFAGSERGALRPLPQERFPFFHEARRIVNRDGHIEVARAYYSVPPEYLSRTVWVRWDTRLVRIFNQRFEQIALHVRHEQGRFSTQGQHLARELKTLDQFDWSFNPSVSRKQVFDLATGRFIREAKDVLFLGPPGVGKSFLVQALGYQAIKQGFLVLYRSIFDVVRDFLHDEAFEGQEKVLGRYLRPDLLIIDDMGMKNLPKRSGEFLFEIIMRRYETRSTMMTSNRPLEDWGKLIGDVPSATAILDRFLHHTEIISITGRSYRLKHRTGTDSAASDANADPASPNPKPAISPSGSEGQKTSTKRRTTSATPAESACQS